MNAQNSGPRRQKLLLAQQRDVAAGWRAAFGLAAGAYVLAGLAGRYYGPWYDGLVRPSALPRPLESLIAVIWAGIFVGVGVALARLWSAPNVGAAAKRGFAVLFVVNLALNCAYSYWFTIRHDLNGAAWIAAALVASVALWMVALIRARVPSAAVALSPYLAWAGFATYITFLLDRLNPAA